MNFMEQYEAMSQREKADFSDILNQLFASTFVVRKRDDKRRAYYFIERHEDMFRQYLSMAGWNLICDKAYGVYQAVNSYGQNRISLHLEESILLLIIRLCYEEKRKEVNLTENIVIRVDEIQQRYASLKIRQRPVDKKTLRDTLTMLKRFNILNNLDSDVTDPDCRLEVYPSILMAVRAETIRDVYNKLEAYRSDNATDDQDEMAQGGSL